MSIYEQINADLALTQHLYKVLQDEKQALAENSYESIAGLAEKKQELIIALEKNSQDYPENNEAWLELLMPYPVDEQSQLTTLRDQLASAWQECLTMNTVNGKVININLQTMQRLRSLLRGNDSSTYNEDGRVA